MKIFMNMINFLVFIYIFTAILLFLFQRSLLYFPTAKVKHSFFTEKFINNDVSIEVIVLNKNKKDAILYFGGNAESVIFNASDFTETFPFHTVYLINYRGYGGSTGQPSEKALYDDSLYIYDEIKKRHRNISVMGRSLGSGIATFLSSLRDINKMILVTPYDSIESIAKGMYPIYPISILLKDKYNSISRVKDIKSETLVILAQNDEIIPLKYSNNLIREFPKKQILIKTIKDVTHNNLSDRREYYEILENFIKRNSQ